ncbi:hypothetical protein GQY06_22125 (plasmid) [Cereibacter sphaeroides]|nr:hypothetical protein GQY06_22125 [Cereibacter sphaeroides]
MSRRSRGASLLTRSAPSRISIDLTASRRAAARSARPALSARPREDRHPNGRRQGVLSDHARLRHDRLGETGRAPAAQGREGVMAPVPAACGRD